MRSWPLLLMVVVLAWGEAWAQPLAVPAPPQAGIAQRLGVQVPMALPVTDSNGRHARLGDFFEEQRPVLLVLGYYRCPQLCGLLMHGLLDALHASGLPRRSATIVRVSIDPEDTPATAAARRELDLAYADFLLGAQAPQAPLDLHLLVAAPADTARLARTVGFSYQRTPAESGSADALAARFAHSAAVLVVTPRGIVSRYLMGIQFDPAELRTALAEAAAGGVGTLADRIALLCAHFDPHLGRYSAGVMDAMRMLGVLLAVWLGAWCWRRRGPPSGGAR